MEIEKVKNMKNGPQKNYSFPCSAWERNSQTLRVGESLTHVELDTYVLGHDASPNGVPTQSMGTRCNHAKLPQRFHSRPFA